MLRAQYRRKPVAFQRFASLKYPKKGLAFERLFCSPWAVRSEMCCCVCAVSAIERVWFRHFSSVLCSSSVVIFDVSGRVSAGFFPFSKVVYDRGINH